MRDDANRYARLRIMFRMRGAAVLLSLSLIAATAQAGSQTAPVAGNPHAAPVPASVETLDDWALATAELQRLSHDPNTLGSTKPNLDRILELLNQTMEILERRRKFLDLGEEILDRRQELQDQMLESLVRGRKSLGLGTELLAARHELLDLREEQLDREASFINEMQMQVLSDEAFLTAGLIMIAGLYILMAVWSSTHNRRVRVAWAAATVALIAILCVTVPDWPSNSLMNDVADWTSDVWHQLADTPGMEARHDEEP